MTAEGRREGRGWVYRTGCAWSSQTVGFERRHSRQSPQLRMNGTATRSPIENEVTPSPSDATIPESSWPGLQQQRSLELRNAVGASSGRGVAWRFLREGEAVVLDVAVVAGPAVPVGAADARGPHLDDNAAHGRDGHGNFLDTDRAVELAVDPGCLKCAAALSGQPVRGGQALRLVLCCREGACVQLQARQRRQRGSAAKTHAAFMVPAATAAA